MKRIFALLCLLCTIIVIQAQNETSECIEGSHNFSSYSQMVSTAEFNFAIFSDNEGYAPVSSKPFTHMVKWMEKDKEAFVIGLGDHVKKKDTSEFIKFLHQDEWWKSHFYPCAADGENQYYGNGQADWGAGGGFFKEVDLQNNSFITMRENGVEYYARIPVKDWTVHLIQLHYPDQPEQDSLAFRKDSKEYLIRTLESIDKGKHDIIIVGAHSHDGFWIDYLDADQKKFVLEKCDLVLSATTHYFMRKVVPGYEINGALLINTGSITNPIGGNPPGYVQVTVFDNPAGMLVQYLNAGKGKPDIQAGNFLFVKLLGVELKIQN
jgi:predicted phosphodiesterase